MNSCVSKCVGELPKEKREEYGEDFFREQTEKIQKINLGDPGQVIEEMVHALTNSSPKTHYIVGFDAQVVCCKRIIILDRQLPSLTPLPTAPNPHTPPWPIH